MTIEEIASRLNAKESGGGYEAKCPHHEDKKPSMKFFYNMYEGKTYVHFLCYTGCSHTDIKARLQEMGILPRAKQYIPNRGYPKRRNVPKKKIEEIQKDYTYIYRYLLDLLDFQEAIMRLDRRGISEEITKRFQIKVLPRDVNKIKQDLMDKFSLEELIGSGLITVNEEGAIYFILSKHRILTPYINGDRIETFQGRLAISIYEEIPEGQHKNISLKGRRIPLYNQQALQDAREGNRKIIICEGSFDVMCVYELGWVEKFGHPIGIAGVKNDKGLIDCLDGLDVMIATDNDRAGNRFLKMFRENYNHKYRKVIKSLTFDAEGVKDINEYLLYRKGMW